MLSCFFVAIPCQSSETQIWVPLTHKGRNTEVHGCAGKEQAVCPAVPPPPNAAPALVSLLWRRNPNLQDDDPEWGVKGQRPLSEDVLPLSPRGCEPEAALWGRSTLQPTRVWASSAEDSEEGQKRAGYFFSPNFIYLPLFYVFCLHVCLCGSVKSWSYRQLWAAMWVLRFEPGSSEKEVSVPNLWAISPAPGAGSFKQRYYKEEMFTALGPRAKSSAWFWLSSGSWWELWSGSYKQW